MSANPEAIANIPVPCMLLLLITWCRCVLAPLFSTIFSAGLETGAPGRVDHHDQYAGAADYDVPGTENRFGRAGISSGGRWRQPV
jgi:hypothetical protein